MKTGLTRLLTTGIFCLCNCMVACGQRESALPSRLVSPYYEALSICPTKARNVDISVGYTGKEGTLAACRITKNNLTGRILSREIIFNADYYALGSDEELARTLYHELGHCWVGLKDLYDAESEGQLMYWLDMPGIDYRAQFESLCQ
jgi:hypothetical protein